MQPTAFGAQDRTFFEVTSGGAPRRRLMRIPFGSWAAWSARLFVSIGRDS